MFVLCGLTVAVIIAILEFCWHSKKKSTDQVYVIDCNFYRFMIDFHKEFVFFFILQSVCTEMAEELRYAIRCDGTKHKATLKRTCNGCSPITTYVPAPMHINHVTSQIVSRSSRLGDWYSTIVNQQVFNKIITHLLYECPCGACSTHINTNTFLFLFLK